MAKKKLFGRTKNEPMPVEEKIITIPDPKEEQVITVEPQPVEKIIKPIADVEVQPQTLILADDNSCPFEEETPIYKVKVIHDSLRRREAPNLEAKVTGYITDRGIYDIYDERDGWGQLKEFDWILLEYTKKV